jgi:hypothetical protein
MRRGHGAGDLLTPPEMCSLTSPPADTEMEHDWSDCELYRSETERLEAALRKVGSLVAGAVADATHRNHRNFMQAVEKYENDSALLQRFYKDMQFRKPHMFRRLRDVVQQAEKRQGPTPEPAAVLNVSAWLQGVNLRVLKELSPGVKLLEDSCGNQSVLKHSFASRECLLRELRTLCLTTGMQGVCQAVLSSGGELGCIVTQGRVAALHLHAIPGIALAEAVRLPEWIAGSQKCAASLAAAVARLHASSLLHGDLHPGNIIVHQCLTDVTLCDLGRSAFAEEGVQQYGRRGWKAPEIAHVTSHNSWQSPFVTGSKARALDVWALSVNLLCMACSQATFGHAYLEQDARMHNLARDIQRDMDLWSRRYTLSRSGPWLDRVSPVWHAAAAGLQTSVHSRLTAARISRLLCIA